MQVTSRDTLQTRLTVSLCPGLVGAMRDALTQLYNLIALTDPEDKPKILVRVELVGGMVQYHPPIDKESADISVQVSDEFLVD